MENTSPQPDQPTESNFQFLFDKLEGLRSTHQELFAADFGSKSTLPPSVEEIKRIVEACNLQENFITYTKV